MTGAGIVCQRRQIDKMIHEPVAVRKTKLRYFIAPRAQSLGQGDNMLLLIKNGLPVIKSNPVAEIELGGVDSSSSRLQCLEGLLDKRKPLARLPRCSSAQDDQQKSKAPVRLPGIAFMSIGRNAIFSSKPASGQISL
jgi:hypothetical protein